MSLDCYLQVRDVLYKSAADRLQCMLGPRMEPVNGGTVHNGRKLPCTCTKSEANRRETQHHLQCRRGMTFTYSYNIYLEYSFLNKETNLELPAYTINEEVPAVFTCVQQTKRPQLHTNRGDDHIDLFLTEEVRYIPYKTHI